MRMEFDGRRLKQMAAVKWRLGPEEWPVKVVTLVRAAADVVSGYLTQLKCVAGRTSEEMERILGLRRAELARGAGVLWLGRRPDREEFALRAYTQCPGGQHYDGHGSYPPGLGVPQWELLCALPVGERVIVKPGKRPRITRKRDETWKHTMVRSSMTSGWRSA